MDVFHLAAEPVEASALMSNLLLVASKNGLAVRPWAANRHVSAANTVAKLTSELLGNSAVRLQLVDTLVPSTPFSVSIELWKMAKGGHLAAARNNSVISRVWNFAAIDGELPGRLEDFLPATPSTEVRFNVDWVFSWVNGQDPDWQKLYADWAPAEVSDASDSSRFEHRDDLRFALRSLSDFAPWVRRIHVVTNCRPPRWLDDANDKIRWVWHEELFAEDELPTFSSHAIETVLHRIPGLSEHFVYSNDDFYLARRVAPSEFFAANGICLTKLEPYGMVNGAITDGDPDYLMLRGTAAPC